MLGKTWVQASFLLFEAEASRGLRRPLGCHSNDKPSNQEWTYCSTCSSFCWQDLHVLIGTGKDHSQDFGFLLGTKLFLMFVVKSTQIHREESYALTVLKNGKELSIQRGEECSVLLWTRPGIHHSSTVYKKFNQKQAFLPWKININWFQLIHSENRTNVFLIHPL